MTNIRYARKAFYLLYILLIMLYDTCFQSLVDAGAVDVAMLDQELRHILLLLKHVYHTTPQSLGLI